MFDIYTSKRGYARLKKIALSQALHEIVKKRRRFLMDDGFWVCVDCVSGDRLPERLAALTLAGCAVRVERVKPSIEGGRA
jgi:hypothetical protein